MGLEILPLFKGARRSKGMNFFIPYHRDGLIDIPEGNREAPAKLEEVVVIDGASK